MSIIKEEIKGNVIYNIIQSSNIVESVYNMESQIMTVKFKNGTEYQYKDVPHKVYTQFRMAESQGKYFTSEISKKFDYKKM